MVVEIERRFLISLPLSWYAKFKLHKSQQFTIYQTYLLNKVDNLEKTSCSRVRCIEVRGDNFVKFKYFLTYKNFIKPGMCEELEFKIDRDDYYEKIENDIDRSRRIIIKTRHIIPFNGKKFELDVFKNDFEGLAILEVELDSLDEEFILPPHFKVIKEITSAPEYSNYNLAAMKSEELLKLSEEL